MARSAARGGGDFWKGAARTRGFRRSELLVGWWLRPLSALSFQKPFYPGPRAFHSPLSAGFHFAVFDDDFAATACENRPAFGGSASGGFNQRFGEALIGMLHEVPGAHIGDAHAKRGGAQAAGLADEFKQLHAAGTQGDFVTAHYPKTRTDTNTPDSLSRFHIQQFKQLRRQRARTKS